MSVLKYLKESLTENNHRCDIELRTFERARQLLYHGSSDGSAFSKFKDYCFFTENDYIAETYGDGGLVYFCEVHNIYAMDLTVENCQLDKKGFRISGSDDELIKLFSYLYGDNGVNLYKKYGTTVLSRILNHVDPDNPNTGFKKLIAFAKDYGYNSLKFNDESFDVQMRAPSYVIFNGDDVDIISYHNPNDDGYNEWLENNEENIK
jgi:hypothetical protein